ncbi:hypothetical protein BHE74_00047399 [Ensete ventricosum]|nr:hypothetical protein GW17_00024685 [Ensete ventricosum]RWW46665.1 hypothetical protein BHE74_00047399 [Ensete ventricosum]
MDGKIPVSNNCLALVPWVPPHATVGACEYADPQSGSQSLQEPMEAEEAGAAPMAVEENREQTASGIDDDGIQQWQQQHCMAPEFLPNTPTLLPRQAMALRKNPSIGNGHRSDLVFAYYITGHGFGHATRVVDVSFRLLSFAAAFARAPTYTPPFPLNPFCLRVVDVTFRFLPFAASFARVRRTDQDDEKMVQFLLTLRGCLGDPKELGEAAERPKPIRCPVSRYRVFDRRILGYDDRGRRWRGLCFAGAPCLRILRDRPWVRSRHPSRRGATIALLLLPLSALFRIAVDSYIAPLV